MKEEKRKRKRGVSPESIVDQLSYLIEEAKALKAVLGNFPREMLAARPYEGELSILDLIRTLVDRERNVRIPNVRALIGADRVPLLPTPSPAVQSQEVEAEGVMQTLEALVRARSALLEIVKGADEDEWKRTAVLDGGEVTMSEYLYRVVQEDLDVLRVAAERVHESRPVGSPGFTAR